MAGHLLALLTPVHSFNLLVQMLAEQRAWRRFAHLPNRHDVPEPWVLHEFRQRLGVAGLRRINEHLLVPLLPAAAPETFSVARIDATDLPAATCGFKKSGPANTVRHEQPWAPARLRRARAVSLSATSSTPSGCGCGATSAGCCWCRWSVGGNVLAHNPDTAATRFSARIDLILSGHTHGGQLELPLVGTPLLPVRNKEYSSGLKVSPKGARVFISKGIGWAVFPVRFNCLPEIAVLELVSESAGEETRRTRKGAPTRRPGGVPRDHV